MTSHPTVAELFEFAQPLVIEVGKYIASHRKTATVAVQKDAIDFSTDIDIQAEEMLIEGIKKKYPSHHFFAEESGGEIDQDTYTWIIDPIDGTKNFFRGLTNYCVAVVVMHRSQTIVSAVYNPATNQLYMAGQGMGAFHNGNKVTVSDKNSLDQSFLIFKIPVKRYRTDKAHAYVLLEKLSESSYQIGGPLNQNLGLCEVGIGAHDAFINIGSVGKWWDYAPGMLFVEEAGGKVVTVQQKKYDYSQRGKLYIAGNQQIVKEIGRLLQESHFDQDL